DALCRTPARNGSWQTSHCAQMSGLRHRFNDFESSTVLKRGYFRPRRGDLGGIECREDHARLGAALGQNATPRIDDEGMAEGFAAVLVVAALRGREHEGAVLDRTRAN